MGQENNGFKARAWLQCPLQPRCWIGGIVLAVVLSACTLQPPISGNITDGTLAADMRARFGTPTLIVPASSATGAPGEFWIYRYDGPLPTIPRTVGNPAHMELVPFGVPEQRGLVLEISGGAVIRHADLGQCALRQFSQNANKLDPLDLVSLQAVRC